jgi:sugar lactone lactonase YvrE
VAPGGAIVKTYDLLHGGLGIFSCLTLSQDGNSFWTCETDSGEVWQVDIATGNILENWGVGINMSPGGIALYPATGPAPCIGCRP